MRRAQVIVTCEHGGNRVPAAYARLFAGREAVLDSHRGWDPGALPLARRLASRLSAPLIASKVTRLLVELNRSSHHRALFSEVTRGLPDAEKQAIVARHYQPYRDRVVQAVRDVVDGGDIALHLSVHSFTPVLDGVERTADVGLLYDPARPGEVAFADQWRTALCRMQPSLRVRRNYPYLGKADGLVTSLRRRFATDAYIGVELEVNQKHLVSGAGLSVQFDGALSEALVESAVCAVQGLA